MSDDLIRLLRLSGPSTWAAVAVAPAVAPAADTRRRSLVDELARRGAPEADVAAIEEAVGTEPGVGSPATRHLIAHGGEIVLDEVLVGDETPEFSGTAPVPDLVPLVRQRFDDIRYLLVEADREGGTIRVCRARRRRPGTGERILGWEDDLRKVPTGGMSNPGRQQHAEENWKQNQSMLAERVDEVVRETRPTFVLVAGDVRATELLEKELSSESRQLVVSVKTHTGAAGASDSALDEHLAKALDEHTAARRTRVVDAILAGHGDRGARGVGPVVEALRSAEVDTLLLEPARLGDRTALALDAEPWIATRPEDALSAGILGEVSAASALVRAALLTDADIVVDDEDEPLDDSGVAASLRWRPGPEVPGH